MSKVSVFDLLPPYMGDQAWIDLAKSIDDVFGADIFPFIEGIGYLRHTYLADYGDPTIGHFLLNNAVPTKVTAREMLAPDDFDVYDLQTERLRLSQNGLILSSPSLLDTTGTPTLANSPTHRLTQNIAMYWYHKGWENGTFIDFINYCLGTDVKLFPLWTTDYKTFFEEGDPIIGTPVWSGGLWYPTTHVRIDISTSTISTPDLFKLVSLFYDIANYNLVLESVSKKEFHQIVDSRTEPGPVGWVPAECNIVKLGLFQEVSEYVESVDMCPAPVVVTQLTPELVPVGIPYIGTLTVSGATSLVSYSLPAGLTATLVGSTVTVSGTSTVLQRVMSYFVFENNCGTNPTSRSTLQGGFVEVGGTAPAITTGVAVTTSAVDGDTLQVTTVPVFTGTPAPTLSYQWELNGVANGPATTVPDTRIATPGTWVCKVTAVNGIGSIVSVSNTIIVACPLPFVVQALTPSSVQPGQYFSGTIVLRNVTSVPLSGLPSWATVTGPVADGQNQVYTVSGKAPSGTTGTSPVSAPVIVWETDRLNISANATFAGNPPPAITRQEWLQNGGVISGQTGSSYVPTLGGGGAIQIRQWGSNGVGAEVPISSNVIRLEAPVSIRNPVIEWNGSALTTTIEADFTSDLPMNPMTFYWVRNDGTTQAVVPGATGTSFSPTLPGTYYKVSSRTNQVFVGTAMSNSVVMSTPQITSTPYIPASAPIGNLITAVPPTSSGFPVPTLSPSWRLNGVPVSTALSYAPTAAGSLTIVWTASNAVGSASAQTATCTVGSNLCPLPAVSSGLPWPAATTGVPYDHTIFLTDTTPVGTSVSGAPPWATVSITAAGSGTNIRIHGTPTLSAVQGTIVSQTWSVRRMTQGNFELYVDGTASHSPSGASAYTNWNSLGPDPAIGPQWVVRFSTTTPGSFTPASQALLNVWTPVTSTIQMIVPGGPPQTVIHATLDVQFSGDGGTTTAATNQVLFTISDNPNS